jgi:hypothetical protein
MTITYNGREVECEIEFNSEVEDCFVGAAFYVDDGSSLADHEMEELTNSNMDRIYDEWYERKVAHAEAQYDAARGH